MNTEIANNKAEVYMHRLFELTDQFIEERLQGDEEKLTKHFRELLFYIADRIERPDNDCIDELDNLFNSYVRLCTRYGKLPTIEGFSFLTKIHRSTFDDWKNMRYRASSTSHADTVKGWLDTCKSFVVDELSNSNTANVNLIFISKAAHGLRETAPVPTPEEPRKRYMSADELVFLGDPSEGAEWEKGKEKEQKSSETLPYLGD